MLFVIIAHYINYEYSYTFSEHSQMIIYGLHPDYKDNFQYPTYCNQSRLTDVYLSEINNILNLDWKIENKNGPFDFWQSEYINRYDYDEEYKNEFDFFVNYLIRKNEILNISNNYNDIIKNLYIKYGIPIAEDNIILDEFEDLEYKQHLKYIENLKKVDKIKYNNIKFTYDINYLEHLFTSYDTTIKFNNLYEIWKCSI